MEDEDEVDIIGEFHEDIILPDTSTYDGMGLNLAELLPELGPNSWLLSCNQNWNLDGDIEVRSKSQNEIPTKPEESCLKLNEESCANVKSQKHRQYWSTSEKELFFEGFRQYGNKWSKISKLLGTRTTLQVKSFAKKLKQSPYLGNERNKIQNENNLTNSWQDEENVNIPKDELIEIHDEISISENIDVTTQSSSATEEVVIKLHRADSYSDNEDIDIEGDAEDRENENWVESSINNVTTDDGSGDAFSRCQDNRLKVEMDPGSVEECDEEKEQLFEDVNFSVTEKFQFEIPEKEVLLEKGDVTLNEKLFHHEFFQGRPQKTPERYMKIRNYILESWEKCKPNYLNKTSVRPGLKNCGDVNCIGRIHSYLEQIGAINFGCVLNNDPGSHDYTIQHGDNGEIVEVASVVKCQRTKKSTKNPFHLLSCLEFSPEKPAPYTVVVNIKAVVVMDVHAHMSKLEVIGLLGGRYDFNTSTLHVLRAEPCRSTSTGLECEMDPVSQTVASEKLEQEGCNIVGWYHSHPTFAPNPSVRDLDTQTKFQHWFSKGGTPFLGIIISPHLTSSPFSKFRYLMVDTDSVTTDGSHQPFKFGPTFVWDDGESGIDEYLILIAKRLLDDCDEYKMSLPSIKNIISGIHRHLVVAGANYEARTAILTNFGKRLVDMANCEESCSSHPDSTENYPELK